MQTEIILILPYYSLQVETLEAYRIVILRSTSLTLGLLTQKLYVDYEYGLKS